MIMKKLLLLLALLGFVFTACEGGLNNEENGNAESAQITLSQQFLNVNSDGAEYSVEVTSSCSWQAVSLNDWIYIETQSGIAGTKELLFSVEINYESKKREGTIVLSNASYNIATELYVIQEAFSPKITIAPESLNFSADGGEKEVVITANCDYSIDKSANWLSCKTTQNGIKVTVQSSDVTEVRTANLTISNYKYNISKVITVSQSGRTFISYTSSDGEIVTPNNIEAFDANIISNTYEYGQGIIIFDAPISSIGDWAFAYCGNLTSITIPNSVTSIGDYAFGTSSLTSVTISDSVTTIGVGAFPHMTLTSVNIHISDLTKYCTSNPMDAIAVDKHLFVNGVEITELVIPNGVTSIGVYAFSYCSSLTSVTIPDSVTSIGIAPFYECSSLTAFYGKFTSADNRCLIIDGVLNSFAPAGLAEYTIPNNVTSIGGFAFFMSNLTSVTIPNGVTSIGDDAFAYCDLTNVTIPDSVTSIGGWAFLSCFNLTSITIGKSVTKIGEAVFRSCNSLTSIYCKPIIPPVGGYSLLDNNTFGTKIYVPRNSVGAYRAAEYWSDYADYIVGYDF